MVKEELGFAEICAAFPAGGSGILPDGKTASTQYEVVYTKTAAKDIPKLKSAHLDEAAKSLIELIKENPWQNPPPYEKLLGNLSGACSRRINVKHRLVYQVIEETHTIKIISLWSHYER